MVFNVSFNVHNYPYPSNSLARLQVVDVGFQSGGQILHGGGMPIKVTRERGYMG